MILLGASKGRQSISTSLLQSAQEQHGWIETSEKSQVEKSNTMN